MKRYTVNLWDRTTYEDVEADSVERAAQIALEWWIERTPVFEIKEVDEMEE
jgi:hypothetical protein